MRIFVLVFERIVRLLAARNLRADRFGTFAAILGVALGTATVNVVLVLDVNTMSIESENPTENPALPARTDTPELRGLHADGTPTRAMGVQEETHEDYEVMRSAIRLGSLSAFLVGALIVFFTFAMVVERRRREAALLRSLGATRHQVAAVFVREAILVGVAGAALGFLLAMPMSMLAARAGITTTGRARIVLRMLWFPYKRMAVVAAIGAFTAMLGILRPARDILRLDVARTLRPRFLDDASGASPHRRRTRGITLIVLPFAFLLYFLMRPFFQRALPSLTFFVLEAALVILAFLATLMLVPDVVRLTGGALSSLIPSSKRTAAARLLVQRRVAKMGDDLAASVSGVMLVFALLLALHVATHALTREVSVWATSIAPYAFATPSPEPGPPPLSGSRAPKPTHLERATNDLPPGVVRLLFTSRTPWPNAVHAVNAADLARFAEASGRPELVEVAKRLGPGKAILSKLMARRYRVKEGDLLEVKNKSTTRSLAIVAVTDDLGWIPASMPYRQSKTYALLDAADFDLIAPFAHPVGYAAAFAFPDESKRDAVWQTLRARLADVNYVYYQTAADYETNRIAGTERDFEIFDVILVLTSILAAVGVTNQLALAVHARRREIALYRVLGMTTADVRIMIVLEGLFVGVLGGLLAVLLGVPLGYAAIGALKVVSAFVVAFDLPLKYPVLVVLGSTALALVASLYPANRAARADSAESIHYE